MSYCKEEITTHPNYPALISVIDFLESGGMDYNAVQADASYIHEFNYPLLAHIRKPGQEYLHLIIDTAVWEKQNEITKYWSGIVVYPEKNTSWKSDQNKIYQQSSLKNKIFVGVLIIAGLVLFSISIFQFPNFSINVFGLLSLLGLIVSIFLLGTELDFQSRIVKQVCGAVSNGGCEKILKSKYAKGFAGITPADASILYFTSQFIIYLLCCWYISFFASIGLLAFAGIAIAAWSIYTQAVKLKQWCALCLGVAAVLFMQGIISVSILQSFRDGYFISYNNIESTYTHTTKLVYVGFGFFTLVFFISGLFLVAIKQLVKRNINNKVKLAELKKWKLDAPLFMTQWQQEQKIDTSIWENDLLLGNPFAPLLITVACNPYCAPCATAHAQLDNLLHRFAGKLKIQIRLIAGAENDKYTFAVKSLLQRATTIQNSKELQQMLIDWFESMDIKKWESKWGPDINIDVSKQLQNHAQWIEESKISFTPTFFLNGKKIPGRYSLYDIETIIPQLVDLVDGMETTK